MTSAGIGTGPEYDVEEWRKYARRDWDRARRMVEDGDADAAGLFLQQAVEKYLKGWLVNRGWALRKTHELDRLLDFATASDSSLVVHRALCERVSGYYLLERYPHAGAAGADLEQVESDRSDARNLIGALFHDERLA
jgi:HEPN domain-containing protein